MMNAFDNCKLQEISFISVGNEKKQKAITSNDDYLFIDSTVEKRHDQEWTSTAQEYRTITAEIKALEKRQKQLRDALISMSHHQNSIGGGVQVSQHARRGSVQYSRIPELQGVTLDDYRDDLITYWKVTEI